MDTTKGAQLDLHCNQIKQQFHAFFDRFANEVRDSYLDELMVPDSPELMSLNVTELKIQFREKLRSKLTKDFDDMWQSQEVNDGLMRKFCSQLCTDPANYFRPYQRSVNFMTGAQRVKMLQYKIKFYQKHLGILQPYLESMFKDLEERRRAVEQTQERHQHLSYYKDLHLKTIYESKNDQINIRGSVNSLGPITRQF